MKTCSTCGEIKPLEAFTFRRRAVGERHAHCRDCGRLKNRQQKARRVASGQEAAYHAGRRDRVVAQQLSRAYGVSVAEYEALLAAQGGVCAICRQPESAAAAPMRRPGGVSLDRKRLAIDHDHASGARRGLLCARCNQGIGAFQDDVERLERAIAYLRHFA